MEPDWTANLRGVLAIQQREEKRFVVSTTRIQTDTDLGSAS